MSEAMAKTSKKPDVDFVIRLVGSRLRPWEVPMRRLTSALDAIQRLMDIDEEPEEEATGVTLDEESQKPEGAEPGPLVALRLLAVRSSSATYQVASDNREYALSMLSQTGRSIESPEQSDWPSHKLSAIADLSAIASALDCQVELRGAQNGSKHGKVFAVIRPDTYSNIARGAFIRGSTSVMARLERVGGAEKMRCGIRLPEHPRMVFCQVATAELVRELGKYIYQDVVVSGEATWFRYGWRLKTILIHSFEPPKVGSIVTALEEIHKAGGHAWDNVFDPESRIAEMRSG